MKSITIKGSKRESVGKVSTKALRNAEQVPCVLYGGDGVVHFSALESAFNKLVYTPDVHTVKIELGSETHDAVLQDIQFHPVTDKILHVDFYQIRDDREITIEVPINIVGTSPGVLRGGVLRKNIRSLKIKALPKNLPDFINADISSLKLGSKLYVTELVSKDYMILHPDNTVVCQVRTSRNASATDTDEDASSDKKEEGKA